MVLVPNFDPGRSLLAIQTGQNIAIDQAEAIQAQQIQLAQEGRAAALAPTQLASAQNVVRQQEAALQIGQLQQLAAAKAVKSKQLTQSLQRISTITDPTKRANARKALNPLAAEIFGEVLQGEDAFDDDDSDGDSELILSQILGPSTQPVTTTATGQQFRLTRLGTAFEQIPVRTIGGIAPGGVVPAQVPAVAPAVEGVPAQVPAPIAPVPRDVIITPAIAKAQRAVLEKAEDRRLAVEKVEREKVSKELDQTEKLIKNAKQDKRIDNFIQVTSNMDRINAATENLANIDVTLSAAEEAAVTGVNDISLIFAFMKMLDPGSVVRESEFATAENAGGIPDFVRAQFNKVLGEGKLSAKVRNNFVSQAKKIFNKSKVTAEGALRPVLKRAKKFGLNELDIRDAILGGATPIGVPAGAPTTITLSDGTVVSR